MKIAVLLRNFVTTGGAEKYAVEVTKRLAIDHDVTVFCQSHDTILTQNLKVVKIFRISKKPRWLNSFTFAWLCHKALKKRDFDVIQSHERTFNYDALVVHCPCYKTKFIEAGAKGQFIYLLRQFISLRHAAYAWLERQQFKKHPKRNSIVVSNYVARNINMCYPKGQVNMAIAPPGVDANVKKACAPKEKESFKILFVGTEFKRKGLEYAIRGFAASKLKNTKLTIAGGGHASEYLQLAESLGVHDRIEFLGLVEDVNQLYQTSHLFLFPTVIEPFGMSPLEAMAHGLPVIISPANHNGFVEQLNDGEAIILKNIKNPDEIGEAIDSLQDRNQWEHFANKSLSVAKRLSWENCAQVHEQVLSKMV